MPHGRVGLSCLQRRPAASHPAEHFYSTVHEHALDTQPLGSSGRFDCSRRYFSSSAPSSSPVGSGPAAPSAPPGRCATTASYCDSRVVTSSASSSDCPTSPAIDCCASCPAATSASSEIVSPPARATAASKASAAGGYAAWAR